ncbi:hypothetical protein PL8927_380130 [Planktothrix serta PCC 8927]|uniref:Uncharacterized protein n=1 Tax=Planktothrix serta PCC 8927 TaxID=671068 RepID=A0A7Z9BMS7_9CYAN|nr:hypothetical protein PL8927_380130 [Planktothrix serta PCC 8927]
MSWCVRCAYAPYTVILKLSELVRAPCLRTLHCYSKVSSLLECQGGLKKI